MPMDGNLRAQLIPLIAQYLFRPKSSELEQLIVSKALDAFLSQAELQKKFTEALLGTLAESFGKRAGEAVAKKIVLTE